MKLVIEYIDQEQRREKNQIFILSSTPLTLFQNIFILLHQPETLLICDICERIINLAPSILLVKSESETKDTCVFCFSSDKEIKKQWSYYVRPCLNVVLTEDKWNILNDVKLLCSLQKFGPNNWDKVKDYLDYNGTSYGEEEIEQHYKKFFPSSGQTPILQQVALDVFNINQFIPPIDTSSSQSQIFFSERIPYNGYNEKRDEHIFDFDPYAEDLIENLQFCQSDSLQQEELKYLLLQEYEKKVEERKKRYQFVQEHKILSNEQNISMIFESLSKKQVRKSFNCFARFLDYQQYKNLVHDLTLYQHMNSSIKLFMHQRRKQNKSSFNLLYSQLSLAHQKKKENNPKKSLDFKIHRFDSRNTKKKYETTKNISQQEAKIILQKVNFLKGDLEIEDVSHL